MRQFESGATRDSDTDKPDYEAFLSPLVIASFGRFMHRHRMQADGKLRDGDNWQKGIPLAQYMKSLFRHFLDLWSAHRGHPHQETMEDALCAILFNTMGYLHEYLKAKEHQIEKITITLPRAAMPEAELVCRELGEFYRRHNGR